jgi:hypothetical protein
VANERQTAPLGVLIASDSCGGCGVQLAADQRYCVECGQPRRPARMPVTMAAGPAISSPPEDVAVVSRPRPSGRLSGWASMPNAAVFAAIGALLLAMGIGVLIGRSTNTTSSDSAAARTTTVVLSGPGASVAAAPTPVSTISGVGTTAGTGAASTSKATPKKPAAAKVAPVKAVHVGSKGTGPGYQGGKFTGNFFGGG